MHEGKRASGTPPKPVPQLLDPTRNPELPFSPHASLPPPSLSPLSPPLLPPHRSANGVDVVTLGQYMRPTKKHMAVAEFVTPEAFAAYEQIAKVRARGRCMGLVCRGWQGTRVRYVAVLEMGSNGRG